MPSITILPSSFDPAAVSLANRNILIAGADTDLGHAIARDLATLGASLILQTSKQRGVASLYDELHGSSGSEPLIAEINLAKAGQEHVDELAAGLEASLPQLDHLIYLDTPSSPLASRTTCGRTTDHECV